MTERPDPLAPPEGYGARPGRRDEQPVTGCSVDLGELGTCRMPLAEIWWWGCDRGEHAGPVGYCGAHAVLAASQVRTSFCGVILRGGSQCGGRMQLLRREHAAGGFPVSALAGQAALDGLGCRDHPEWNGRSGE